MAGKCRQKLTKQVGKTVPPGDIADSRPPQIQETNKPFPKSHGQPLHGKEGANKLRGELSLLHPG